MWDIFTVGPEEYLDCSVNKEDNESPSIDICIQFSLEVSHFYCKEMSAFTNIKFNNYTAYFSLVLKWKMLINLSVKRGRFCRIWSWQSVPQSLLWIVWLGPIEWEAKIGGKKKTKQFFAFSIQLIGVEEFQILRMFMCLFICLTLR